MKKLILPIYEPGKKVWYKNNQYAIDHVRVQQYDLLIKLVGVTGEILSGELVCEPTEFILKHNTN